MVTAFLSARYCSLLIVVVVVVFDTSVVVVDVAFVVFLAFWVVLVVFTLDTSLSVVLFEAVGTAVTSDDTAAIVVTGSLISDTGVPLPPLQAVVQTRRARIQQIIILFFIFIFLLFMAIPIRL